MKSERRHELKENALASELGQIKTFFAQYGNWVLTAVAVVVLIGLAFWAWQKHEQTLAATEWNTYQSLIGNPTMLERERDPQLVELINTAKVPAIAAGAALFYAESLTNRYTITMADPQNQSAAAEYKTNALTYYQLILERYSGMKPFVARAYVGMGKLAEDDGEFAKAREDYEQAIAQVKNSAYPIVQEAQRRLQHLGGAMPSTSSAPASQPVAAVAAATADNWTEPVRFSTSAPASRPAASGPAAAAASARK